MKKPMLIFGIHTRLIKPGDSIVDIILKAMIKQGLKFEDKDVMVIASKAVAIAQNRIVKLSSVKSSRKAEKLAEKYELKPSFVEIVLEEAEKVHGGVSKALLASKNDTFVANAGVDHKNAPEGYAVLWPKNPHKTAEKIRKEILAKTGKHVGILIIDSSITPLRIGTTALAIGIAGFRPVKDCRIERDLYGRRVLITRHALADDLASTSHLIMGETTAKTPAVLVRNAPVTFSEKVDPKSMTISPEQCLFTQSFLGKTLDDS